MGLVQITAADEIVQALLSIPDLHVVRSSVESRGPGRWKVAAYASDEAIEAAGTLGAEVRVMLPTEADLRHRQETAADIAGQRAERGEI